MRNAPYVRFIDQKPPPRPVVGLPLAPSFQECVAMDLKFYHNKILLHLIDHTTRISATTVIPSKDPDTIIEAIFNCWRQIYGSVEKFLTDNGGEFANSKFLEMRESMNIRVITAAAESPFSNGLIERYNLIISEMLDKTLEDTGADFQLTLAWCVNAKDSLANVHGFSPFQLALGQNPKIPLVFNDKPPAMSSPTTSKFFFFTLTALHKAREAYIASESSEKIHMALNHNVRTSGDTKYITGDSVYFKCVGERQWGGPRKVLDQDRQQVLVKYRSSYVTVHPCRLTLERNHDKTNNKVSQTLNSNGSRQEQPKERHCRTFDEDSDEELDSQEEQNNDKEMNMLSNSMERLSMSQPIEPPPTVTEKKNLQLKKT